MGGDTSKGRSLQTPDPTLPSLCRRDGGFQSYRQVEHFKVIQGAPCITVLFVSLKDLFRICPLHYYYFSLLLSSSQSSLLSPYHPIYFSSSLTFRSLFPIFTTFQNSHTLLFFGFSMSQLLEHSGIGPASRDLYYSIQLHNYFWSCAASRFQDFFLSTL